MSLITLFADGHGLVASRRAVFGPDEVQSLQSAPALAESLQQRLVDEEQRIAQAVEEATQTARAKAEQEGRQAGERAAADQLATRLLELDRSYAAANASLRREVASLACEVVRQIAKAAVADDWLTAQASQAAAAIEDQAPLTLFVSDARVAGVRQRLANARNPFADVQSDPELDDTDCVIASAYGRVDASLDSQLSRLDAMGALDALSTDTP